MLFWRWSENTYGPVSFDFSKTGGFSTTACGLLSEDEFRAPNVQRQGIFKQRKNRTKLSRERGGGGGGWKVLMPIELYSVFT